MTTETINAKSAGLGGTVFEFPAGSKRQTQPQPEPEQIPHTLDLMRHLPDCNFKRYVIDVAKMTRIPANTSLLVGLGIVSSVTTRCFVIQYEKGGYQPLCLYVLAEQDSGTGKSWMLSTYQAPVFSKMKELIHKWRTSKNAAEAAGLEFNEPFPQFCFDTDATPEGLDQTLSETNGYFALASAEQGLANSISGAGYGSAERKGNKDLWLKGFNAEYHSSKRSQRKGYTGRVIGSVVNFAQPGLVQTILSQSENSGAAERCLMISEPSQLGKRKHGREHRHYPNEFEQNTYNRIMTELTAKACINEDFEALPGFRLSLEDWDKVYALQDEFEPRLAKGGKYDTQLLKSMVSKTDLQVTRLAANLAIMDECPPGLIPSQWVEAAIHITRDMFDYVYHLLIDMEVIGLNAFENSIISYLGEKPKVTRKLIRTNKYQAKPWKEIPRNELNAKINETVDSLISKRIVIESETFDAHGNSQGKCLRLIA